MNTNTVHIRLDAKIGELRDSLASVIRGKEEVVEQIVIALVAGGSVLIEDVPGVGKTTLAKTLAALVELDFQRVQCTPDLLPADIFGFSVFNPQTGEFRFRQGPIFTNVLLLDEINRASPRTQSALLEAMAEHQVTVEGAHYPLLDPFLVLATQNPLGFQGTFPLPESQLDRFLVRLSLDYPDAESEVRILYEQADGRSAPEVAPVISRDELLRCQAEAQGVHVERCVADYLVRIVQRTRADGRVRLGCSPRGSLMLFRAAKAAAFVSGRDHVTPDDVQRMVPLVLAHRLTLESGVRESTRASEILGELVAEVDVPI